MDYIIITLMKCALMIKLIPLYYLENLLSDEIFEGGTCSLKGQRSPNEHLIKYKAFLIFSIFCYLIYEV